MKIDWQQYCYDLFVYGQAVVHLQEEEKQVKQIDFSKPVVSPTSGTRHKVKVLQEGLTLVEITDSFGADGVYAIDEHGAVQSWQSPSHKGFGLGVKFANKPEEPNDHLCLYKAAGEWAINASGTLGPNQVAPRQLQPKSYWGETRPGYVIVKVPV